MYKNSKPTMICPVCGKEAHLLSLLGYYKCKECSWDSWENTLDIAFSDPDSAVLSNLFPHKFSFYTSKSDETTCLSMESFIQSLRVKDPILQKYICEHYSGPTVQKLKLCLRDWREDGIVYWQGVAIKRDSATYTELITTAYDCLFESNPIFRELVLPAFKGKHLIHTISKDSKTETLLTESEFRFQLNRLIKRLDYTSDT